MYAGHTVLTVWQSDDISLNVPFNKGERLIIVHAETEEGFMTGAMVVFKAGSKMVGKSTFTKP